MATPAGQLIAGALRDKGGAIYNVLHPDIGAKGDARTITDGSVTTGTAILGSALAGFNALTDAGKLVIIPNAGTPLAGVGTVSAAAGVATFSNNQGGLLTNGSIIIVGGISYTLSGFLGKTSGTLSGAPTFGASAFTIAVPLYTTILSVQSLTQATLAANAGRTVSGNSVTYGTDDTPALKVGLALAKGHSLLLPPCKYMVSAYLPINVSGSHVWQRGATVITWGVSTSLWTVGDDGAGNFVKTDDVVIGGGTLIGQADGSAPSAAAYGIGFKGPAGIATDPYVKGAGCSRCRVIDVREQGFCLGFSATGADDIRYIDCTGGGNAYIPSANAGGHVFLFTSCFSGRVVRPTATATCTDRHVVYCSRDPNRNIGTANVCRDIIITEPQVNWFDGTTNVAGNLNVGGATGFEAPFEARSVIGYEIRGGSVRGGYGGLDFDCIDGPGSDAKIMKVSWLGQISDGVSTRACVNFARSGGSSVTDGVTIQGCIFRPIGALLFAIILLGVNGYNISGNEGTITNSQSLVAFNGAVTNGFSGNNTWIDTAGYVYSFSGAGNSGMTFGKDHVVLISGGARYNFSTTPAVMEFGYVRTALLTASGAGVYTITNDPESIITSFTTDANGLAVTLSGAVNAPTTYKVFAHLIGGGTAFQARVSAVAGQVATVTIQNQAGALLPGATNAVTLSIEVTS
jgi:hypothetical protein